MNPPHETMRRLSPTPLYEQLKEVLRERILNGTYQPHARVPSVGELARTFKLSRITVCEALNRLEEEKLIFKLRGKGTYVFKPKVVQDLAKLQGFSEALTAMGYELLSRVVSHKAIPATKTVATKLQLKQGELVSEISRVHYLDDTPISLDVTHLPIVLGERLANEDLAHRAIFSILESDYGYVLAGTEFQIEAAIASEPLTHRLNVPEGTPILSLTRLNCTAANQPLAFEYLYCRADTLQYRLRLERARPRTQRKC